jgi:hypothetical protein
MPMRDKLSDNVVESVTQHDIGRSYEATMF